MRGNPPSGFNKHEQKYHNRTKILESETVPIFLNNRMVPKFIYPKSPNRTENRTDTRIRKILIIIKYLNNLKASETIQIFLSKVYPNFLI